MGSRIWLPRLLGLIGLFAFGACDRTSQGDVRENAVSTTPTASTTPDVVPASAGDTAAPILRIVADRSAWYHTIRELDVTGDGRPDTLLLRAFGNVVDSLAIAFSVVTAGDTILVDGWKSNYQLIDPPEEAVAMGRGRDEYVRRALDSTLAGVYIDRFSDSTLGQPWIPRSPSYPCEDDVKNCIGGAVRAELAPKGWTSEQISAAPFDTTRARAVIQDIRRTAVKQMFLAYGYETVVSYVWSPLAKKFYMVSACC